uniref:Proteinase-activated receptor 4 n=1 Tax=Lepisosteus oculatus TaxID=7918 RepID=W5N0G1_LEPOC|nr:PREDICTED: proteinase-activated receptor 4-like [Lepisosteus oculatus]
MDSPSFRQPFSVVLLFITFHTFTCEEKECVSTLQIVRSFNIHSKCNRTVLDEKDQAHVKGPVTTLLIPLLYLLALVVGLPANVTAMWVLLAKTKKMPSTILLINLTTADLLLILVLPFRIAYHFQGNNWIWGESFCRTTTAMFYGNMYGSILCLMLISIDRYIALVHPFGAKVFRSRKTSIYMSLVIWVIVIGAMLPLLLTQQSYTLNEPNITLCHDALPQKEQETFFFPYFASLFTLAFVIPFCVILFCYCSIIWTLMRSQERYTHAAKITALVLVVFIACFLPSNMILLIHYSESHLIVGKQDLYVPYLFSLALSTFNSFIDPFIYYYVSEDFRNKAIKLFVCCRTKNYFISTLSSRNQDSYSASKFRSVSTEMSALNGGQLQKNQCLT